MLHFLLLFRYRRLHFVFNLHSRFPLLSALLGCDSWLLLGRIIFARLLVSHVLYVFIIVTLFKVVGCHELGLAIVVVVFLFKLLLNLFLIFVNLFKEEKKNISSISSIVSSSLCYVHSVSWYALTSRGLSHQ